MWILLSFVCLALLIEEDEWKNELFFSFRRLGFVLEEMCAKIVIEFRRRALGTKEIYDFDRYNKDVGVAQFTTKNYVVRNCLPNAKSDICFYQHGILHLKGESMYTSFCVAYSFYIKLSGEERTL
ncbi:protein KINKY POLLEN-like isoform X2 [Rosa rugosa]|uniref:protein KINKY POLLEN-like isoform X2 n=1 Tax=Rosa rugosa TaxID=74645 RepID=UPI002B40CC94|nr:protein KINKY POLLEN-like isoform X2 [Rosa rugosa]